MRKIKIFKFFLIFLIFSPCFSFAEGSFRFSVEPFVAYSCGEIDEYIYDNSDTQRLLSKLEWERNLFLYGAEAKVSLSRLSFAVDFMSSVHKNFGDMRDSDWMNDSQPAMKTTYSVGKNEAVQNYDTLVLVSFDFFPFDSSEKYGLVLSPFVQFQYSYDSFERNSAEGWYGQMKNSSDGKNHWWYEGEAEHLPNTYWNEEKGRYVTRKLAGISYECKFYSFYVGSKFAYRCSERLGFNLGFAVSPFLYNEAYDTHYGLEARHYKFSQQGFFESIKISSGGFFSVSKNFDVVFDSEVFFMNLLKGSYTVEGKKDYYYNSGAKQFSLSAKLGFRLNILAIK